jgi:predicted nucleic acid-binding protein
VIYIDSSVLLASVFEEPRSPPVMLWDAELTSSRLLEYEVWNRLNAYGLVVSHGNRAQARLNRINLTEISEPALARALEPFLTPIRTLDALHLATIEFLRRRGELVELASYDNRMIAAARALGFALFDL